MQAAATREFDELRHAGPGFLLVVIAGIVVAGYALYVWADQQLRTGLGITGMNAPTYWGAYIVNFVFFVGLSAGGIIVSALVHALKLERYRAVARMAEVLAIICIALAGIFITLDVGRPDRIWHLAVYGRWQSPLVWDVMIIGAYLAMALALGYFSTRADMLRCMRAMPARAWLYRLLALGYTDESPRAMRRDAIILRVLAFFSIPAAIGLHSVTAWIMGLAKATPGWHTALLAPVFIGSALVSGLALVVLASFLSQRLLGAKVTEATIRQIGLLLLIALPVLGYLLFSEMLTVVYAKEVSAAAFFEQLTSGDYAPFFWFDVALGLAAPLVMLVYILWLRRPDEERETVAVSARAFTRPAWGHAVTALIGAVAVGLASFSLLVDREEKLSLNPSDFSLAGTGLAITLTFVAAALLVVIVPRISAAAGIALASLLVVAGVLAERINIVLAPQISRFSSDPKETFALPYSVVKYRPTVEEISITVGVYALGVLAFMIFSKVFPLTELPEPDPAEARVSDTIR